MRSIRPAFGRPRSGLSLISYTRWDAEERLEEGRAAIPQAPGGTPSALNPYKV
jgi:hypothetical protein